MKRSNQKEFLLKTAGFALFGLAIFILLTISAILFYNNYNFYGQMLSELGVGETGFLFNFALIISALCIIPFFYAQFCKKSFLSQTASIIAIASMLFLAGVGVFPLSAYGAHIFTAGLFFILAAFAVMIFSVYEIALAVLAKKHKGQLFWKGIIFCVLGFFVAEFSIFFLFISRTPLNQKMAVALIFAWIVAKILIEVEREVIAKKRFK